MRRVGENTHSKKKKMKIEQDAQTLTTVKLQAREKEHA